MTESTFTLNQARKLLAREACELDLQGGLLVGYNPCGWQQPKRLETLPLGHDLAKAFGGDGGYTGGFKGYKCLRCGAEFVEVVTGDEHQLPVSEPAP